MEKESNPEVGGAIPWPLRGRRSVLEQDTEHPVAADAASSAVK